MPDNTEEFFDDLSSFIGELQEMFGKPPDEEIVPIGKRVLIAKDCRDDIDVSGQFGTYEGHCPIEIEDMGTIYNPRIRLDDGSEIWGFECFWVRDADETVGKQAE